MCAEKKKRILLAEADAERDALNSGGARSAGLGGWLSSVAGALGGGGGGAGTAAGHVKALRQELGTWETLAGVSAVVGGGWLRGWVLGRLTGLSWLVGRLVGLRLMVSAARTRSQDEMHLPQFSGATTDPKPPNQCNPQPATNATHTIHNQCNCNAQALLVELMELKSERQRALDSRTLLGHARNALGYAMSVYCVYRVVASFKALLFGEDFSGDPVSRCRGRCVGGGGGIV